MLKKLVVVIVLSIMFGCQNKKDRTLLFVGSFTDKELGKGIKIYEFDQKTGEAILMFELDSVINSSFLRLSPSGKNLYSVLESQMEHHGKVAAFSVDSIKGTISLLNIQDCGGVNPAHIEIDKTGSYLVNSNYSDGSLSLFKIKKDGSLNEAKQVLQFKDSSIIKSRQRFSHIHSSNFSPDNKYLFAHDLGADKIRKFTFDNLNDSLKNQQEIKSKLGSGPRHFTFHPNGLYGYGINELSGTIAAYRYKNGTLSFIEDYLTYQQKQGIYRAADIHISTDGKFLYASNRGPEEDSIVVFSIEITTGKLTFVERVSTYGEHPRNFVIDPSGEFLLVANQFSDTIVIFRRNIETGELIKPPHKIAVANPSSLQMSTYKTGLY